MENACPNAEPLVVLQIMQVFGSEHVAFFQECPVAVPSVAPQEQVFGAVQVAVLKLWVCDDSALGRLGVVVGVVGGTVGAVIGSVLGAEGIVLVVVLGSIVGTEDTRSVVLSSATEDEGIGIVVAVQLESVSKLVVDLLEGTLKIDIITRTAAMILLTLLLMNFWIISCHFVIGIIRITARKANILNMLGKNTIADRAKNTVRIHAMILFTLFIILTPPVVFY